MIGLLLAAITAVNFGRSVAALNYSNGDMTYNDFSIAKIADNTTFVQWHNNLVPLSSNSASLDLFEQFGLKTDEALRSSDVFIQQENVLCEYGHSIFEKGLLKNLVVDQQPLFSFTNLRFFNMLSMLWHF